MKKILLLLIAIAWTSSSCEKDDICDANTPTTPRLVIDFYDKEDPTVKKNVTNLTLFTEGYEDNPPVFNGVSQIKVPLKTTADSVQYKFTLNYANANPDLVDEDIVTFNYARTNVFVSRACGFKTIFSFRQPNPYVLTDASGDPENLWIETITMLQPVILTENEVHLKITF